MEYIYKNYQWDPNLYEIIMDIKKKKKSYAI